MGFLGGSSSSTQSLNNSFSFNPVINVGDDNTSDASAKLKSSADATSTMKDEFGLSAGVAFGGNAQGGAVSRNAGDVQPMNTIESGSDGFFNDKNSNMYWYILGGGLALGGFYYLKSKKG